MNIAMLYPWLVYGTSESCQDLYTVQIYSRSIRVLMKIPSAPLGSIRLKLEHTGAIFPATRSHVQVVHQAQKHSWGSNFVEAGVDRVLSVGRSH